MEAPHILIVEDAKVVHDDVQERLGDRIKLSSAYTTSDAYRLLASGQEFSLIALDGIFPRYAGGQDEVEGPALLAAIRSQYGYGGMIITISSTPTLRACMVRAGCTFECQKNELTDAIGFLFGLQHQPH